jgi:hypothetical protein
MLIAALVSTVLAVSAPVQKGSFGNWSVDPSDGACILATSFGESGDFAIFHDAKKETVMVLVTDPVFRSIVDRKSYPLTINLFRGNTRDTEWGSITGHGVVNDGHRGFVFRAEAAFLDSLVKASRLQFTRGTKSVADIPLDEDIEPAVAYLQRCARIRAGLPVGPAD